MLYVVDKYARDFYMENANLQLVGHYYRFLTGIQWYTTLNFSQV